MHGLGVGADGDSCLTLKASESFNGVVSACYGEGVPMHFIFARFIWHKEWVCADYDGIALQIGRAHV